MKKGEEHPALWGIAVQHTGHQLTAVGSARVLLYIGSLLLFMQLVQGGNSSAVPSPGQRAMGDTAIGGHGYRGTRHGYGSAALLAHQKLRNKFSPDFPVGGDEGSLCLFEWEKGQFW